MSDTDRKAYFRQQSKKYYSVSENRVKKSLLAKKYRQEKKEEIKKQQKIWQQSLNGRLNCYKARAKHLNLEFSLSLEQFEELTNSKCFYCNQFSKSKNFCRHR